MNRIKGYHGIFMRKLGEGGGGQGTDGSTRSGKLNDYDIPLFTYSCVQLYPTWFVVQLSWFVRYTVRHVFRSPPVAGAEGEWPLSSSAHAPGVLGSTPRSAHLRDFTVILIVRFRACCGAEGACVLGARFCACCCWRASPCAMAAEITANTA